MNDPAYAMPREGHVRSQGLRLRYLEWGNPAAPPLLLVHGSRDHAWSWASIAGAFAGGWRVIAPDLRGHGDSDRATGGYALLDLVRDLAVLVDHVAGEHAVPIVAHSLGGNVAVRYAGLFPERVSRLVAIEGLGPATPPADTDPAARLRDWIVRDRAAEGRPEKSYADVAAAAARMRVVNPRLSDGLALHLAGHGTRTGDDGRVRFKFDPAFATPSPVDLDMAEKIGLWRRITCPVLLCWGRQSWATNPAEDGRAAYFRDVAVEAFDDAGHWLHHDRRDMFVATVARFIGRPPAGG